MVKNIYINFVHSLKITNLKLSKYFLQEFSPISKEDFLQKIYGDIKDNSLKSLIWHTKDGIDINTFYTKEDVNFCSSEYYPLARKKWNIAQKIVVENIEEANKKALKFLNYGVDELHFILGKELSTVDFTLLLKDIKPTNVFIYTDFFEKCIDDFLFFLQKHNIPKNEILGGIISLNNCSSETIYQSIVQSLNYPNLKIINPYYKCDSVTKEISYLLYNIILIFYNLLNKDISIDTIIKKTFFTLFSGNSYFLEIAKLRAFRVLWAHLMCAYKAESLYIHLLSHSTISSSHNQKHFNLLETQSQAMASVLGNVNSVYLQPFDRMKKYFSEKIACFQQILLKEETLFGMPLNSVDGSYYIETVTKKIAQKSWDEFLALLSGSKIKNNFSFLNKIKLFTIPKHAKKLRDSDRKVVANAENIPVKLYYTKEDVKDIEHIYYDAAGIPPFLRGPYSTMYVKRPWTIRQYAGFSTAEESNNFFKNNLIAGQKGLSVAFDLPTHRGYDSDHPDMIGDVGKTGVAVDSMMDIELLFSGIPLDKISVSFTMNGAVLPIMAFYIATAINKGIKLEQLRGTIQNDILKEFIVRNTYIYPPKASMRIVKDVIEFISKKMPKFNSVSISGYHFQEAGASKDIELAFTLCNGLEYLNTCIDASIPVDKIAPKLSFFWAIGMDHFMEIAKLRAARVLWAKIVKRFNPKNPKSLSLRAHCQTSGWSLTKQEPYNNIGRTYIEAMAAVLGHTQSLHTNSFDEAVSLPTEYSAKIARDTQIFIQEKTGICNVIDPFAGSYYVENLTNELIHKTWKHIENIEKMGGMTKALENGYANRKISESAINVQAEIDSKNKIIVGVNKYIASKKEVYPILEIHNTKVVKEQIKRLNKLKEERNYNEVQKALDDLTNGAKTTTKNLLELSLNAAQKNATLGEISLALEKVFGRYKADSQIITGVYKNKYQSNHEFIKTLKLSDKFTSIHGRRPRILVAKMGQDGHDRGIKVIASGFSDAGFDVDVGPLFQTPKEVARQAVENDVHLVGISSLAGSHKTLIPKLIEELKKYGRNDILVILGGIIPYQDYTFLYDKGVAGIFESGTSISTISMKVLELLIQVSQ